MKPFRPFLFFSLLLLVSSCADKVKEATHGEFPDLDVRAKGERRHYRLYVPESVDLGQPAPLLVAFHGLGIDSKDLMPLYSGLNDLADAKGLIVVYPASLGDSWGLNGSQTAKDVAFFDVLMDVIGETYKIDDHRIYLTGMSNGAYFAHELARQRSHQVAAVAAHSGILGLETALGINSPRKYPVLLLHGKDDPLFDISLAVNDSTRYANEGHEVDLIRMDGLGHEWGSAFSVNDSIWTFLESNPL
jgi:polyhydroxybutyrate depolymerase